MAALAISARYPLGTFLGHEATGQASDRPDTARLHSALVHAAGKGSCAVERDGDLRISDESRAALRWLEEHPPAALGLPPSERATVRSAGSYRDDGVLEKRQGGSPRIRKVLKNQSDAVAISGRLWWVWEEDVPPAMMQALDRLCADVSCLGEADSPVVLEVHEATAAAPELTHRLAEKQSSFPKPGGVVTRTPATGRIEALERDYALARPKKGPTLSADRSSTSQAPNSLQPTRVGLRSLDYRPIEPTVTWAPWMTGLCLHVDAPIRDREVVRFCAALHKTLSRLLGMDVLPLLTGNYADGVPRPANRLALHYMPSGKVASVDNAGGAFLVLIPGDADANEADAVRRVASLVTRVYLGSLGRRTVTRVSTLDATSFWPSPAEGTVRFWRPALAAVPEINRPRRDALWSLDDTALLSLGHVVRDRLSVASGTPEEMRRRRVEAIKASGARSSGSRLIADAHLERYVHRAPQTLVVQPYTTTVHTGGLIPDRAIWALGQSRHLGGGLMFPFDLAPEVAHHLLGWSQC